MNNKNYDRMYYENEQYNPNQASPNNQSRVIEIPVIHCQPSPPPSSVLINQNIQPSANYNSIPTTHNYQQIPTRSYQGLQQPTTLFDNIDPHFDLIDSSNRVRRGFQDPDLDEFFTQPFETRSFFTGRNSPLNNRLGSDHLISPRRKLSPNRFSPSSSPNVSSPQFNRKVNYQQDPVTIPVNYAKSPTKTNIEYDNVDSGELPFNAYRTINNNSSPKPNSYSDSNFYRHQSPQTKLPETFKPERSPSPNKTSPPPPPKPQTQTKPVSQQQQQPHFQSPPPPPPQQPTVDPTMGQTNSNTKQQKPNEQQSSFVHLAAEAAGFQTPPRSTTPQLKVKTSQEKIDDISVKLDTLEKDVNNYKAPKDRKKDRQFLLLEESLTQCLLKLDEIDRDDEKINQIRKKLIGSTHKIIDKLDSKFNEDNENTTTSNSNNNENDNNSNNNNNNNNNTNDNVNTETNNSTQNPQQPLDSKETSDENKTESN